MEDPHLSVADQGFPGGGRGPVGGHGPPTRVLFTKMYAKMKELGPIGVMHRARPLGFANAYEPNMRMMLIVQNRDCSQ